MLLAKLMSQPHEYSTNSEISIELPDVTFECIVVAVDSNTRVQRITSFSILCLIYVYILSLYSFDLVVLP